MFAPDTKILVVDDMSGIRGLIMAALKKSGLHRLVEAENGAIAWKLIQEAAAVDEPFQLIVSDWNMPEMSGLELLRMLKAQPRLRDIPFLMVTTENEKSNVLKALTAGASHFVVKPFNDELFTERLLAVYEKHFGKKAA